MKRAAFVTADDPVPADVISDRLAVDVVPSRADVIPHDATAILLNEVSALDGCLRAEHLGYDGVMVADYGLKAARAALRIPIVGTSQAGMLIASSLGRRFGIVTVWPEFSAAVYSSRLHDYGLAARFAGVRHVTANVEMETLGEEDNFYVQTRSATEGIVERVLRQVEAAVREDGADVVLLGCNCMRNVAPALAARTDVPIVEPVRAAYKLLDLQLSLGVTHSAAAFAPMVTDRTAMFREMAEAASFALAREDAAGCGMCAVAEAVDHA
jgi:allantoin racemase